MEFKNGDELGGGVGVEVQREKGVGLWENGKGNGTAEIRID